MSDSELWPTLHEELFAEVIAKIEQGDTIGIAMNGSGYKPNQFYKWLMNRPEWKQRYAEARQVHAQVKADQVDGRVDELAMRDEPNATIVKMWAGRHNPAYRDKVEVDVTTTDTKPFENMSAAELESLVSQLERRLQPQIEG